MRAPGRLAAALAAAALALTACGGEAPPQAGATPASAPGPGSTSVVTSQGTAKDDQLTAFADCADLERQLRHLTLPHVTAYGLDDGSVASPVNPSEPASRIGNTGVVTAPGSARPNDDVDNIANLEDLAAPKTDGRLLLTIRGGTLRIFDVSTRTPAALGTMKLTGQYANSFLLAGKRALLLGRLSDPSDQELGGPVQGPGRAAVQPPACGGTHRGRSRGPAPPAHHRVRAHPG